MVSLVVRGSVVRHRRLLMRRQIVAIKPVPGLRAALGSTEETGVVLGFLTSNSAENLRRVLVPEISALFRHAAGSWSERTGIRVQ
jgi:hypothetical protein